MLVFLIRWGLTFNEISHSAKAFTRKLYTSVSHVEKSGEKNGYDQSQLGNVYSFFPIYNLVLSALAQLFAYIGSTIRPLSIRCAERSCRSSRANNLYTSLAYRFLVDDFTVLFSSPSEVKLRSLESIFIFEIRPKLISISSADQLALVNRWH